MSGLCAGFRVRGGVPEMCPCLFQCVVPTQVSLHHGLIPCLILLLIPRKRLDRSLFLLPRHRNLQAVGAHAKRLTPAVPGLHFP
jgi:hypothetical protein